MSLFGATTGADAAAPAAGGSNVSIRSVFSSKSKRRASASGLRATFDATATARAATARSGEPPRLLPSQLGAATERAYGVYLADSHAAALLAESMLAPDAPLGLEACGGGS